MDWPWQSIIAAVKSVRAPHAEPGHLVAISIIEEPTLMAVGDVAARWTLSGRFVAHSVFSRSTGYAGVSAAQTLWVKWVAARVRPLPSRCHIFATVLRVGA